ncbi:MAG: DUF2726 domain-containing protein [Patescibacteria group bacterium]
MTRNYKYYRGKNAGPLDIFFDALISLIFTILISFFRYCWKLFKNRNNTRPNLKLSRATTITPTSSISPQQNTEVATESRYILKESLVTNAEKEFLKILENIVGNTYHIESQVPLSGIVKPIDSNEHWTNYRDFNLIKAKSIDFVLYDKAYKPYLAIELDDRSHSRWDRIKRDQIVNEIMKGVGLRILHVPVSHSYDSNNLGKEIFISNER